MSNTSNNNPPVNRPKGKPHTPAQIRKVMTDAHSRGILPGARQGTPRAAEEAWKRFGVK
jgi:hypothetical protein